MNPVVTALRDDIRRRQQVVQHIASLEEQLDSDRICGAWLAAQGTLTASLRRIGTATYRMLVYDHTLCYRRLVQDAVVTLRRHRLLEVLQHALRRRGGVYHFIGGVDDTLCEVRGIGDDPLGAGCPCAEEQPHQKECQTSFHSYSTGVSNSSAAGCVASSGRNRP